MSYFETLKSRIENREARIAVFGLGYVGLPLSAMYASAGFNVTGIEQNLERIKAVMAGKSYLGQVTDEELARLVRSGRLRATGDVSAIAGADVIAICVPTPIDRYRTPDTSYIEKVIAESLPHIHRGQLLILESTTYPGSTEEIIKPRVEMAGMTVGEDYFLAFSPERIDPGNRTYELRAIARVVGGVTPRCTDLAVFFLNKVLTAKVIPMSSPRAAEMTKLLENTFRVVNVSLVNEIAQLCRQMDIDIWEVIEAAKSKPYGFMPFYPGPGVGGHCIGVDPFYLAWRAKRYDFTTRFIELAGQINDEMPQYVVGQVARLLNTKKKSVHGSRILMLGLAFKPDVEDVRESSAVKVAEGLKQLGGEVHYHDPWVPAVKISGALYKSVPLTEQVLKEADISVLTTHHSNLDYELIANSSGLIYDTRNGLARFKGQHIHRLGAPDYE